MDLPLHSTHCNHASATEFSSHVDEYIREELQHGAIIDFYHSLIPLYVCPFMIRPKSGSYARRTISDLSWPRGNSVNDEVAKIVYMGMEFQLKYPSVASIVRTFNNLGSSCSIFKIDICGTFRHICIDPGDLDLLGLQHLNLYYLDDSLSFGYRLGSFFQKLSNSIRLVMNKKLFKGLHNYIDDQTYCDLPSDT